MRYRVPVACVLAAMATLALPAGAMADGMYFPEVAYPAMPTIPMQRALIVHRDGVETLIVESTFKSDSPGVGWVLPLPAEPTKFEVADSGILTTLAVCLGPEVIHDLRDYLWWAAFVYGCLIPLLLVAVLSKKGVTLFGVIYWLLAYIVIAGLLLPGLGHAGLAGGDTCGVQVSSAQKVGNYEVSVVRGKDGKALAQWLQENGLRALTPDAIAVADDYIARGWCFAVARLRREAGGEAVPHPIAVTFPAGRPIYPMRLTGIAGSRVHVELYVVADRMAAADGFRIVSADSFKPLGEDVSEGRSLFLTRGSVHLPRKSPESDEGRKALVLFEGQSWSQCIGQPDLLPLMWDGCVLTRLEADLAPSEMREDVGIRLETLRPQRQSVFSSRGRREAVLAVLAWGAVPLLGYVARDCNGRRKPSGRQQRVMAVLAGAVLMAAGFTAVSHRVVAVGPSMTHFAYYMRLRDLAYAADAMVYDGRLHSDMTNAQIEKVPSQTVEFKYLILQDDNFPLVNPFTGGPTRCERSPGNLAKRRIGKETFLCVYDRYGAELLVAFLPPPGAARQGVKIIETDDDTTAPKP